MAEEKPRKTPEEVRNEGTVAKEKRRLHAEKIAAYDVQYKAAAVARREKLAAEPEAQPAPAEAAAVEPEVKS